MGTLAAASSNRNRRKHQRHRIEEQQQQQRAHHPQLDTGIATEMPHASHPTGEQVAGQFHWLPWTVRFRTENALRLCVTTPTFPSNDGTEPLRFFVTTVQLFGKSLLVPEPEKSVRYSWGTMVTPVLSRYILTLSEFRTSLKFIFENIAADMPLARPPVLRRPLSHFSHHIHSLCDAGRVFHTPTSPMCRFT